MIYDRSSFSLFLPFPDHIHKTSFFLYHLKYFFICFRASPADLFHPLPHPHLKNLQSPDISFPILCPGFSSHSKIIFNKRRNLAKEGLVSLTGIRESNQALLLFTPVSHPRLYGPLPSIIPAFLTHPTFCPTFSTHFRVWMTQHPDGPWAAYMFPENWTAEVYLDKSRANDDIHISDGLP